MPGKYNIRAWGRYLYGKSVIILHPVYEKYGPAVMSDDSTDLVAVALWWGCGVTINLALCVFIPVFVQIWFDTLTYIFQELWPLHQHWVEKERVTCKRTEGHSEDVNSKDIGGLVQDCSISIALAMEILQSCTKPSICTGHITPGDEIWQP